MSGIRTGLSAMLVSVVVVMISVGTGAQRAGESDAEKQLARARQKEVVEGNIAGAVVEYRAIADRFRTSDRPVAAKALLLLANAYTVLKDARAAATFAELAREFGDLPEGATARSRGGLPERGAMSAASDPRDETRRMKRRVWGHRYLAGRPSPDGRYLPWANYGRVVSPAGPGIDLVLHDLRTGTDRPVTKSINKNDYVEAATFTPDGKRLLYTWFDAKNNEWQIRLIDADGRNDRLVRQGVVSYLGVVAPGGQRAAVAARGANGQQVAMLDLQTGAMQTLRTTEWGAAELGNFSPDGRYLVYSELVRQGAEERNIDLIAVDGSRKTTIASGSSNRHPFFTPDGRHVVFTSNRSGQWDLWMVPVAGDASAGAAVMADSSIGAVTLLGFTTDGTLFYQQPVDRNQAWEVDIDPETRQAEGSPRPLSTRFVGNQNAPTWSPDGSRLVIATRRTAGAGTLVGPFSFTINEGGVERTTEASGTINFEFTKTLRWFPDRHSLLLVEWKTDARVFSRLDLRVGSRDVLFQAPFANALSTSLSSDGASLFYVVPDETDRRLRHIVRRVLASGEERRITTVTGNLQSLALSPDGRTIAFLLGHQMPSWCLWTAPADGGEAREVWEPPSGQILFGTVMGGTVWATDGQGLFVTIRDGAYDGPQSLWYVPLDTARARAIGVAMEQVSASSAHPDGRRLAFTSTASSRDVWTLSNLRSN